MAAVAAAVRIHPASVVHSVLPHGPVLTVRTREGLGTGRSESLYRTQEEVPVREQGSKRGCRAAPGGAFQMQGGVGASRRWRRRSAPGVTAQGREEGGWGQEPVSSEQRNDLVGFIL